MSQDDVERDAKRWATGLELAEGLSAQAWVDLAPHLSCREAELVKAFLLAWKTPWVAQVFIEAHANSDDDEGDLHYQGGGADS
jgi:hypothetical protein